MTHEHQPFRDAVKARFHYCSPFRLGVAVGEAGAVLLCPYKPNSRGEYLYLQGLACGQQGSHSVKPKLPKECRE